MTTYTNVGNRAILVSLQISTWAARRLDKKVSGEVAETKKADQKAGRYNVHLMTGDDAHEKAVLAAGAARQVHYNMTLPWSDDNWRLLPTANYMAYTEAVRKALDVFDGHVHDLLANFDERVDASKKRLGKLASDVQFPDRGEVREKFSHSIDFRPVPSQGDIRANLPAAEIAEIEEKLKAQVEAATKQAMQDAWARLHEAVARVQHATREKGIIRDTLIQNVRDVVEVLGRLNVAQDDGLEQLRLRACKELGQLELDDLRDDDKARADAKRKADDIMAAMAGFYRP